MKGMSNSNSNSLSIIKNTAIKFVPDCKVFLFGSYARNENTKDSDFDFLIITKETFDIHKKRAIKSKIRKVLAQFKIPADILIQSQEEIDLKKTITGHILKQVLKEGIVL